MQLKFLKNIIITTLPIFAYLVCGMIFRDMIYSLAAAMAIGIAEFIVTIFIYKKMDFFILIELVLILALGMVSIFLKNDIFFKLKPAVMESILLLLVLILVFSRKVISLWISRYLKSFSINEGQIGRMQNILAVFIPVLSVHIALIIITAFFFSETVWAFTSGALLYIIFGLMMLSVLIFRFAAKKAAFRKYRDSEWFDILDETGKVIGRAPREICHNGSKLLHPVVHIHIINSAGMLLLQKRSVSKDIQPGKWDTSVGGHIQSGESLENALKREALEEQGVAINAGEIKKLARYIFESDIEKEYVFSFVYRFDGEVNFQRSEIDEVKFWSREEIVDLVNKKETTVNFEKEFKILTDAGVI